MKWLIPCIVLCLTGSALAQGRYTPQGAAQRHFADGERLQQAGDALRDKRDLDGARKKWKAAIEAFREAQESDPAYVDAYVRLGTLYYSLDKPKDVLPLLEQGLKQSSSSVDLRFWYGQNLMAARRTEQGVRQLERVAGETDRYPEVYVVLGNHYYSKRNFQKAQPAFEQYLKLEPDATAARAKLGNTYFKLERYQDALSTFQRVREEWPKNVLVMVNIGNAHYSLGQYDKAVEMLEAALKREPDRQSVHFNLAQSYFQLERYKEAVEYYRRYLQNEPQSFNGNYFMGSALMEMKADDQALAALSKAATLKPKIAQPHYKIGLIQLRRGKTDAAEKALQAAAKAAPKDPWIRSAQGTVARQRKQFAKARQLHGEAAALAPKQARLHANLAKSELLGGATAGAESSAQKALAADDKDPWVRAVAASVLGARAKQLASTAPTQALTKVDRALQLSPGSAPLLTIRGSIHAAQGQVKQAGADAEAAVKAAPNSGSANLLLGRVMVDRGQYQAALAPLQTGYERAPSAAAAATLAAALQQAGQLEQAESVYEGALAKWPEDATLNQGRAKIAFHVAAELVGRRGYSPRGAKNIAIAFEARGQTRTAGCRPSSLRGARVGPTQGRRQVRAQSFGRAESRGVGAAEVGGRGLPSDPQGAPPPHGLSDRLHHMLLQNFDRAEALLAKLRQAKRKGTPEAALLRGVRERLGLAEYRKGDLKSAGKLLTEALRQGRTPQTAHNLAVIQWRQGKKKVAQKAWRKLIDRIPEAVYNLAVAVESAGDHRQAYQLYKRYAKLGGPAAEKAREAAEVKQRVFGFGELAP